MGQLKQLKQVLQTSKSGVRLINSERKPPDPWRCKACGKINIPRKEVAPDWMSRKYLYYPVDFCSCEDGQRLRRESEAAEQEHDWIKKAREIIAPIELERWNKYRFLSWERFRADGAAARWQDAIERYVDNVKRRGKNWLYVHGNYGTGKTHLSVAATRKIAANNLWIPSIIVWPEICTITKENWGGREFDEAGVWKSARTAGILLIDDLDKLPTEQWAMGKLLVLINYRSDNGLPTIITANHSIEALREMWKTDDMGSAVASRIAGQLSGVIEMKGTDSRWV